MVIAMIFFYGTKILPTLKRVEPITLCCVETKDNVGKSSLREKKEEKRSSKRNALICIIYAGSRSLFPLFSPVLLGSTNNLFPCSRQRAKVAQRKKTSKMGKGKKKEGGTVDKEKRRNNKSYKYGKWSAVPDALA